MKKTLRVIGLCLLALYVVYTLYYLWQQSQPEPTVYELVSPERRNLVKRTTVAGSMEARRQVTVKPQATGIISRLLVKPGDKVRAGDIIATVKIIPDMAQLNEARSRVEAARINLSEVQREYDRTHALYKDGVVSREEYEMQSSASVSGTSVFTEGTTVAKIADMSDIIFRGFIDETEVALLQTGMDVELHLGTMQEVTIPAKVSYIARECVMQNGAKMFEVKADATIPDGVTVRSGYSANATIVLGTLNDVLACDEKAISFEAGKPYVYVLTSSPDDKEHQQFERRDVTIGISDGLSVELKGGVKKGELLRGNEIKEQAKGTGFVIIE